MPPATVHSLVDDIRQRQLLDHDQVTQLVQEMQTRFTDPRALAQHLLQRDWLTPYQINQLLQGQGAGLVLGQYRLLERLGEGGMGQVFKARHQALGRIVAIKVIRKDRLSNANAVRRFKREIQAASKLSHPNVVLAFDAAEIDGTHFFAMEYVAGLDLTQIIRTKGPLPVDLACEYIRQAALGLQHAHERGLVHRDIKPSNLLVTGHTAPVDLTRTPGGPSNHTAKPVVKVLDLGLARWAWGNDDESMLSQEGSVMGTPEFMAPEQAKHSQVDHRADLYSLGCTFFYLLAGKPPFSGGSSIEKLLQHQMDAPPLLSQVRNDAPSEVQDALNRMLAKRPEDRPQSGAEVALALVPFCPGGKRPTRSASAVTAAIPPPIPVATLLDHSASTPAFTDVQSMPRSARLSGPAPNRNVVGLPPGRVKMIALAAATGLFGIGTLILIVAFAWSGSGPRPASNQRAFISSTTGAATNTPAPTRPVTTVATPPPTVLDRKADLWQRAVPESTTLLFTVNVSEVLRSPIYKQNEARLPEAFGQFKGFILKMGVDFNRNLDRLALAVSNPNDGQVNQVPYMILMQGNFSSRTFQDVATDRNWKSVPVRGRANLWFYQVDIGRAPQFIGLINESLLVLASSQQEVMVAYDHAMAERPAPSQAPVNMFLDRLAQMSPPIPMALFMSGNFRGAQMDGPLRKHSVRDCFAFLRLGGTAEIHVSVDVMGPDAVPAVKEGFQALLEGGSRDGDPFGRLFKVLSTANLQAERSRLVLNHAFTTAELDTIFGKGR